MEIIDKIDELEKNLIKRNVDDKLICSIEERLQLKFADDYREYLKNYGIAFIKGHELTGITEVTSFNIEYVTKEARIREEEFPKDLYVIEELGIDYIIICQNEKGEVFQFNPKQKLKKICDGLLEYILNESM